MLIFILILIAILITSLVFRYYGFTPTKFIKEHLFLPEELHPITFIFIYVISIVLFVPLYYLTFNSVLLYGTLNGALYSVIGIFLSSLLSFYIARIFAKPFLEGIIKERFKPLYHLDLEIAKNSFLTVLILRISPVPFNLVNIFSGITRVKTSMFIIGTMLWMIPETLLFALLGGWLIFEFKLFKLIIVFIALLVFYFFKNKLRKINSINIQNY